MCINNINANCFLCSRQDIENDNSRSFIHTFDTIQVADNEPCNLNCYLVILVNIVEDDENNPLLRDSIPCRLTLVNKETGHAMRISDFNMHPSEGILQKNKFQCKSFNSKRYVYKLRDVSLSDGKGVYLFKLWMKDINNIWRTQTMSPLYVI